MQLINLSAVMVAMLGVCLKPGEFDPRWDFVEIQFEKSVSYSAGWKFSGPRFGVHAPYYITLASPKPQKTDYAIRQLIDAGEVARRLNADIVVARAGFYSKQSAEEAMRTVVKSCTEALGSIDVPLGIETQPKSSQFGSLDEVMRLSEEVGIVPVLDLAAIRQRSGLDLAVLGAMDRPYIHFDSSIGLEELAGALPKKYTAVGKTTADAEAMEAILSPS